MKAEYDKESDALLIDLVAGPPAEYVEDIDDAECMVGIRDDRPVSVELLDAADHLSLLAEAADQYGLDAGALVAAARAAMAAPYRQVTIDVAAEVPA